MKIALIGTGLMGAPMARNIAAAGYQLSVWNRSRDKAETLADVAYVAESAAEAVQDADVVISMVSNGAITAELLAGQDLRGALKADAIWVEMSSVKPSEARSQSSDLAGLGLRHLDAPVSGGTKGAEAGTLAIMAGGDAETFAAAKDVLAAMGRPIHVGPSGTGQLAKLANQAIVAVTIGAVSEAMLLIEDGGGDPAAVRDALKGGFADSTILQQHGERMTTRNFVPGGHVTNQIKDLDNALEEGAAHGLTLPLTAEVRRRFQRYMEEFDGAHHDHSALFVELLDLNGKSA